MRRYKYEDILSSSAIKKAFGEDAFLRYLDLSDDDELWHVEITFKIPQGGMVKKLIDLAQRKRLQKENL